MEETLNTAEMRQFVEALERQGLTQEGAALVASSSPFAGELVLIINKAVENKKRFPVENSSV